MLKEQCEKPGMSSTVDLEIHNLHDQTTTSVATSPQRAAPVGIRAFIITFGTNLLIEGCTVIQAVLIARVLGPIGRGEYAAVTLWPALFAAVTLFGSNIAIARIAAKEPDQGPLYRSAVLLGLTTSLLGATTCYLAIPWLMPSAQEALIPVARAFVLFVPLNHMALNLIAIDQGSGHFQRYNVTRAILNPIYLGLIFMSWRIGIASVRWFAYALLVANLIVVIVRILPALRYYRDWSRVYSPLRIFRQSLHFGLAGIAGPVYTQVDQALLLWLLGAQDLGLYAAALSASSVVSSVTNASGIVTFTAAAQANYGEGFSRIVKTFRISLLSWLVLGGALAIIMPLALPLVYGSDFAAAVAPARLLIIGSACAGLSNQLEQALRGQGKAYVGLEGRLAGLAVMATLAIPLAPVFGLEGVCIAFVLGRFLNLLVVIYRTNRHYSSSVGANAYFPGRSDVAGLLAIAKHYLLRAARTP